MNNKAMKVCLIGAAMAAMSAQPKETTPDSGEGGLIDWHDPEKISKAEKKRARKAAKRLYDGDY